MAEIVWRNGEVSFARDEGGRERERPAEADRDRAVMFEPHDAAVVSLATLRGIIHQWISDRDGFDVAWAMR